MTSKMAASPTPPHWARAQAEAQARQRAEAAARAEREAAAEAADRAVFDAQLPGWLDELADMTAAAAAAYRPRAGVTIAHTREGDVISVVANTPAGSRWVRVSVQRGPTVADRALRVELLEPRGGALRFLEFTVLDGALVAGHPDAPRRPAAVARDLLEPLFTSIGGSR